MVGQRDEYNKRGAVAHVADLQLSVEGTSTKTFSLFTVKQHLKSEGLQVHGYCARGLKQVSVCTSSGSSPAAHGRALPRVREC